MKHTPGPWVIHEKKRTLDSGRVITEHIIKNVDPRGDTAEHLFKTIGDTNSEHKANAQIVVAAPDMLKACKVALSLLDDMHIDDIGYLGHCLKDTDAYTELTLAIQKGDYFERTR